MGLNNKYLEEKSKEFLKSRLKEDPENLGFNPGEIKDFSKYALFVNYLLNKEYLVEKPSNPGQIITVGSVKYILTNAGKVWASV